MCVRVVWCGGRIRLYCILDAIYTARQVWKLFVCLAPAQTYRQFCSFLFQKNQRMAWHCPPPVRRTHTHTHTPHTSIHIILWNSFFFSYSYIFSSLHCFFFFFYYNSNNIFFLCYVLAYAAVALLLYRAIMYGDGGVGWDGIWQMECGRPPYNRPTEYIYFCFSFAFESRIFAQPPTFAFYVTLWEAIWMVCFLQYFFNISHIATCLYFCLVRYTAYINTPWML